MELETGRIHLSRFLTDIQKGENLPKLSHVLGGYTACTARREKSL
jgi:hypothetical protein